MSNNLSNCEVQSFIIDKESQNPTKSTRMCSRSKILKALALGGALILTVIIIVLISKNKNSINDSSTEKFDTNLSTTNGEIIPGIEQLTETTISPSDARKIIETIDDPFNNFSSTIPSISKSVSHHSITSSRLLTSPPNNKKLSEEDYEDLEDDYFETSTTTTSTTPRPPSKLMQHPNYRKFNIKCGTVQSTDRIQNSQETKLFEHPWMIVLVLLNKTSKEEIVSCGGTLLNEKMILTAAHCIRNEEDLEM